MGLFGSKDDAAAWRAKDDELDKRAVREIDEKGQDHPDARAAYDKLAAHQDDKPLRLFGRR